VRRRSAKQYPIQAGNAGLSDLHCLNGADHLHAVPLGRWFPKRTYGVVLRKGQPLSPAGERFVEMLRSDALHSKNGRSRKKPH
jgi:hypothetical protein